MKYYCNVLICLLMAMSTYGQEEDLTGYEISLDQDFLADFIRDDPVANRNYATSLRLGFYGEYADHTYLGLPYVRRMIDGWFVDRFLEGFGFREEGISHNFVLTINGFSPSYISDEDQGFIDGLNAGYRLEDDRPFSGFTGFRSTRRLEGNKLYAHSTTQIDFAVTTSFSAGLASIGPIQGIENLFGFGRPSGNLWDRDEAKPYPTGHLIPRMIPLFMYSLSVETVLWRPMKRVLLQVRPEVNLGQYTNVGLGFDFGKVMNTNRLIDNLSYTDFHNPGMLSVSNEYLDVSLVAGITGRVVLYNAHLNGLYGWSTREHYGFGDMKKLLWEGYVGLKVQMFKKIEFNFSVNRRSSEFTDAVQRNPLWGTLGFKYLMGEEGEGCYDR